MAHPRMVDAYVRDLLHDTFGTEVGVQKHRYILPLPARPVVEVVPAEGYALRVQVAAPVATDVTATPALLEALNDINGRLPYGRLFLVEGRVWAEHTVLGETVDHAVLDNAVQFVCWVVRAHGERLAAAGHGHPAVQAADAEEGGGRATTTAARGLGNGARDVAEPAMQLQLAPTAGEPPVDEPVAVNAAGYL